MADNNNPWGQGPNSGKDPEELIKDGIKKLKDMFSPKGGGKPPGPGSPQGQPSGGSPEKKEGVSPIKIVLILFAAFLVFKSVFQVEPGEKAVILQFGKYSRTAEPGLNFAIPFVESVFKVNIEIIQKEEFGFRSNNVQGFNRTSRVLDIESLMLTADKNVVNLNWVVQYNISNPIDYLFNISEPASTIRDVSETAIRRLAGNRDFDYVLDNREELALSTKLEMQDILNKYKSGIRLQTVQLQDVTPPDQVRPSFNEVNEADQDKTRLVNEAQREYNNKIPKASGEAKRLIEEARGYAIRRVNDAKGEVARFNAIYLQYKSYRKVTRQRLYLETLREVMPQVAEVLIVDNDQNIVPLVNLTSGKFLNSETK